MFDKVNRIVVQAILVAGLPKPKPNWFGSSLLPSAALAVSLSSLGVSWMAYSANQEGMNVVVQRDIVAALEVVRPEDAVYPDDERADAVYVAKWNVSIVNTSVTATTPITGFNFVVQRFNGAAGQFALGGIFPLSKSARFSNLDGSDIELPVALKAGDVRKFILTTTISVSKKAFTKPPTSVPAATPGSLLVASGEGTMDAFGNEGEFSPASSYTTKNGVIAQPCVRVTVETGRSQQFSGVGYWYNHVYAGVGGTSHEVRSKGCHRSF